MNLILLSEGDFVAPGVVRLDGRRFRHVREVHRAAPGDDLMIGVIGGRIGSGRIVSIEANRLEMHIDLTEDPPPPLPVTLVLALPRPKVLNRVVAAAASMGVKRIFLINAWRVDKSYWATPRLTAANLREQALLGLEQAKDTGLPSIETRRLFRRFVEQELPAIAEGSRRFVAHPRSAEQCPRAVQTPVTLAIGPEGGFIDAEIESLRRIGFAPVALGPRILRVETAVAAVLGRLF